MTAICLSPWHRAQASTSDAQQVISKIIGNQSVKTGRIYFELPPLVENGNLVAVKCAVQSPMTAEDHVRSVHVFAEGNPLPAVLTAYFTPHSGKAALTSRIRLAESQRIWAVAVMSDGSFWQTSAETLVTLSACTEER
ncbi:MAG: SoxY-related AACIE arm protein [Burkholderiaceae bacterium]|nr:SoxY-related AACIE arm protein [Burkholderiaceae bacterium]